MNHEAVLKRVTAWAAGDPAIRAVVLTGSLVRGDGPADTNSDLDIELYTTDPAALLDNEGWYHAFGEVLVVEALANPGWHPTRLVYYADGKIDFMIAPVGILDDGVEYDRGFRVLLDKDGLSPAFRHVAGTPVHQPAPGEFLRCVHWFYASAIMWARNLARHDPWAARVRDWDSKKQLLTMLEWDHRARKGWDYDTWYGGAHLREWVDPELLGPIAACWAGFSDRDSAMALRASLSLFEQLSHRTASALGMTPFDAAGVRRRVEDLLSLHDGGDNGAELPG